MQLGLKNATEIPQDDSHTSPDHHLWVNEMISLSYCTAAIGNVRVFSYTVGSWATFLYLRVHVYRPQDDWTLISLIILSQPPGTHLYRGWFFNSIYDRGMIYIEGECPEWFNRKPRDTSICRNIRYRMWTPAVAALSHSRYPTKDLQESVVVWFTIFFFDPLFTVVSTPQGSSVQFSRILISSPLRVRTYCSLFENVYSTRNTILWIFFRNIPSVRTHSKMHVHTQIFRRVNRIFFNNQKSNSR